MRSLSTKLSLAFLLIGILGAVLVALITTQQVRAGFDRFVAERGLEQVVQRLEDYYAATGSWDAVQSLRDATAIRGRTSVFDMSGNQVLGPTPFERRASMQEVALEVDGEQIGTLFMRDVEAPSFFFMRRGFVNGEFGGGQSPETRFLNDMMQATMLGALGAAGIALLVGVLLSRGIMRPIRALTMATQKVAAGEFGEPVAVATQDEIGRLATAFNQMSHDLADASQKRRQLTADIAHDLRTPLTILRGYMDGLRDGSLNATPNLIGIMHDEVAHLEHLVSDLRTLSLAETGTLPLNKRAVDPKALLERTGLKYVMQAEQQGVGLRVDASADLPDVLVDADRMTQVLNNLVSNALRFTTQGEIVLSANRENGHVNLQVSDTGRGISADALPHVFDRFYRADESRQRNADGSVSSGLGLAIAQAMVQAHEGNIVVDSIAKTDRTNGGTTFTISLPISP